MMSKKASPPRKLAASRIVDDGLSVAKRFGRTADERALFKLQHAAICYIEAFKRHIERQLIAVTGDTTLSAQDCMILHGIRMGLRPQSIPDIQHFLNRSDVANIQYGVKKLVKAGLVEQAPRDAGRGTSYRLTAEGDRVSAVYVDNRHKLLSDVLKGQKNFGQDAEVAAHLLITLTGTFDHLSRTDEFSTFEDNS
jgi:predicted MarR family transcription regulator